MGHHGKWLLLLFDINQTRSLLPNFTADAKYEISRKFVRWGCGRIPSVAPGRTEMTKLIDALRCHFEHAHTIQHFDHTAYLGLFVYVIVIKPRFSDSQ